LAEERQGDPRGKLTDLIWNGGKTRKAADSCQVSLIFDNSDRQIPVEADEVKLTAMSA